MNIPIDRQYLPKPKDCQLPFRLDRIKAFSGWILQTGPMKGVGGAFAGHASVFIPDSDHRWDVSGLAWETLEKSRLFRTSVPTGWLVMGLDRARGQTMDGEEIIANSCNLTFVPDERHEWGVELGGME